MIGRDLGDQRIDDRHDVSPVLGKVGRHSRRDPSGIGEQAVHPLGFQDHVHENVRPAHMRSQCERPATNSV
ncbi:hypothetical protein SDC9_196227 [bioreactor metagenome]|uniref:Uncharacterized protein n=1 Tax=bioreactor metagenome TaxID=1076179 RepID=A0A645IBK8_9ZZZZ